MATFQNPFAVTWPDLHGREDYEVVVELYTAFPPDPSNALNVSEWQEFKSSAHPDDNTSAGDPPDAEADDVNRIVGAEAPYDNVLRVYYGSASTGALQESGALQVVIDLFGRNADGLWKKLGEGVAPLDRSVSL